MDEKELESGKNLKQIFDRISILWCGNGREAQN